LLSLLTKFVAVEWYAVTRPLALSEGKALAPLAAAPALEMLTSLVCAPGAASMSVTNTSVIVPLASRLTRSVATLE
jgi:hypothetical protein